MKELGIFFDSMLHLLVQIAAIRKSASSPLSSASASIIL